MKSILEMKGFFYLGKFSLAIFGILNGGKVKVLAACVTILGILLLVGLFPIVGVVVTAITMALINVIFKE